MPKVAYRFVPCAENGSPRENSHLTLVHDEPANIGVGSVIEADLFGYKKWEVVEVRSSTGPLVSAAAAEGEPMRIEGTLVCRALREHS